MQLVLPFVAIAVLAADISDKKLFDEAVKAAETTTARLQAEGAAWKVTNSLPSGAAIEVAVEQFPASARYDLRILNNGKSDKVFSIIAADGLWFVEDENGRRRYRPFEATLPIPLGVHFLTQAELQVLSKDSLEGNAIVSVDRRNDPRLEFRLRGTKAQRDNISATVIKLQELEAQLKQNGGEFSVEVRQQFNQLNDWLEHGFPVVVDRRTGILLERGARPKLITCGDFTWQGKSPPWKLRADEWIDHSQPFAEDEFNDLIQIGFSAVWRPGEKGKDTDLMLLNVRNGKLRRLPFSGSAAMTGCFSADRSTAYISGLNVADGNLALYAVDLMTGQTSALDHPILRRGHWMKPRLSPDGKSLAVAEILQSGGLKSQLYVIDLKTTRPRPVGESHDLVLADWHPDGDALIVQWRETDARGEEQKSFVATVSLDGKVNKLCEGSGVCVLPTARRILFEDATDERRLKTCDLTGADIQLLGDGRQRFGFPTASTDGRLLMMRFVPGKAPQPCIVDITSGKFSPLEVPPGLWVMPGWK